jgi:hypothetical protein
MHANETNVQRYPRPPANGNIVWQRVPPSGRMVDLDTGDYVTPQTTDIEHRRSILHLHDKNGAIARVFHLQLSSGESQSNVPFSVRVTSMRDPIGSPKAELPEERVSVERLTSFLAVWPLLNQPSTANFVVEESPAHRGTR